MFSCTFVHRPRLQFIQSLLAFECRKYNLFNRPLPECLHGTKIVHYSCLTLTSMVRKGAIKLLWLLCGILLMHSAAGIASPPSLFAGDVKGKVILRRPSRDESKIVSRSIIRRYVNKTYQRATSHDQRPAIVETANGRCWRQRSPCAGPSTGTRCATRRRFRPCPGGLGYLVVLPRVNAYPLDYSCSRLHHL